MGLFYGGIGGLLSLIWTGSFVNHLLPAQAWYVGPTIITEYVTGIFCVLAIIVGASK